MKNNIPYTLVDTAGQVTAVIDVPILRSQQPIVAKPLMKRIKNIGQVCFVEKQENIYCLQMMGNELSVNGVTAGGFYLLNKLRMESISVKTSGIKDYIKITKSGVFFPKTIILNSTKNFVDFGGICYQLASNNIDEKKILRDLTKNRPAAGIIYNQKNKIKPLIFVKATNTYVWETACGSASIAYSLVSGKKTIEQPSGIKVKVDVRKKDVIYSVGCRVLS